MENNEKNYYEMLEIAPDSTQPEIEEAYRNAKSMYSDGSVALYSLYSAEERQQRLSALNDIYETLKDPLKRKSYDEYLKGSSRVLKTISETANEGPWSETAALTGAKDAFDEYTEASAFKESIRLRQPFVVMEDSDKMAVEKYRMLYTRLEQLSLKNAHKTFAVTSAVKGEGKTMTSLNLAYLMATEFKKKVLLIESDLRNPAISTSYIDIGRLHGLVDVIKGEIDLRYAINRLEETNLYFLPARCSVKNSSVLLNSPYLRTVFSSVKADFDYIIVDSPPILPLVDMNIISRVVDGMILVVKAEKTPRDIVKKAFNAVPKDRNFVGIVLNGAADTHMKKYYY